MRKLLFILTFFLAAVACDSGAENSAPIIVTPNRYEVEATVGGTYSFTTDVPAFLSGYGLYPKESYENLSYKSWKRPKTLPATFEQEWFTVTQLTDNTFEATISEEHNNDLRLEIYVNPYEFGAKFDGAIRFYLQ